MLRNHYECNLIVMNFVVFICSDALNILMACGPFTLSDDLDFAPMQDLIKQISTLLPHVVILAGPFLDARNKKVESADLGRTFQEEFDLFVDKLQSAIPKYRVKIACRLFI